MKFRTLFVALLVIILGGGIAAQAQSDTSSVPHRFLFLVQDLSDPMPGSEFSGEALHNYIQIMNEQHDMGIHFFERIADLEKAIGPETCGIGILGIPDAGLHDWLLSYHIGRSMYIYYIDHPAESIVNQPDPLYPYVAINRPPSYAGQATMYVHFASWHAGEHFTDLLRQSKCPQVPTHKVPQFSLDAVSTPGATDVQDVTQAQTEAVDVTIKRLIGFQPDELVVKTGTTVRFVNPDPTPHNVRIVALAPGETSSELVERIRSGTPVNVIASSPNVLAPESEWEYTFTESGVYGIVCDFGYHYGSGEHMTIVVTN